MPTRLPARPDLLDLRTIAGRWRVTRDEELLPVIEGRRGNVAAFDLEMLVVFVHGSRVVAKAVQSPPAGWMRHQVGSDEANLLVPVANLDTACRLVGAYIRRQYTAEQRAELRGRLRKAPNLPETVPSGV